MFSNYFKICYTFLVSLARVICYLLNRGGFKLSEKGVNLTASESLKQLYRGAAPSRYRAVNFVNYQNHILEHIN